MRKLYLMLAMGLAVAACGGNQQEAEVEETPAAEAPAPAPETSAPAAPADSAAATTDSAAQTTDSAAAAQQ
ncbi:MAG TPA: hypothetical protein VIL13_07665 [Longimicrobiales bacterium]